MTVTVVATQAQAPLPPLPAELPSLPAPLRPFPAELPSLPAPLPPLPAELPSLPVESLPMAFDGTEELDGIAEGVGTGSTVNVISTGLGPGT